MPASPTTVRRLQPDEAHLLSHLAPDVFDRAPDAQFLTVFLSDPCHHLLLAMDGSLVVGMATALVQRHIDRPPQLLVTELAVTPSRQREGIARGLVQALMRIAKQGCARMVVMTQADNSAALALYRASGGVADEAPAREYSWQV